MNETIEKVYRYVSDNHLLPENKHLLCAVSGGADSMTLLHIFSNYRKLFNLHSVSVFHLNHSVRGSEADNDESFVREYCMNAEISCYVYKLSEKEVDGAGEEQLRDLRYKYLLKTAEMIGADYVATGHTLNDQAETLLLNLGRGAGLRGLSGIPSRRDNIIRPILCLTRDETERYCVENQIQFCLDSTNYDSSYKRNYVRNKLIPVYSSAFDNLVPKLSGFTDTAREADRFFRSFAADLLGKYLNGVASINTLQLVSWDNIILEYVLMQFYSENNIFYDRKDIINSVVLLKKSGRLQLKGDYIAEHYSNVFRIYKKDLKTIEESLNIGNNEFIHGKSVHVTVKDLHDIYKNDDVYPIFELIDCDKVVGELILRNWKAGDTFSSFRRKNTKTLKKLFNEKKLSPFEKNNTVIIADDNGIVWLEGEGVSADRAVDEQTKKAYVIDINGGVK